MVFSFSKTCQSFRVALFLLFAFALLFLIYLSLEENKVGVGPFVSKEIKLVKINPAIFENNLKLHKKVPKISTYDLKKDLKGMIEPQRPDLQSEEKRCFLTLNDLDKRVFFGKKIYLSFKGDKQIFSKEKTPFWIIANLIQPEKIEIVSDLDTSVLNQKNVRVTKNKPFLLELVPYLSKENNSADFPPVFQMLNNAKYYGADLLFEKEFKLEVESKILQVEKGTLLVHRNGNWEIILNLEEAKGKPIAKVVEVKKGNILIEAWDVSGDEYYPITLSSKRSRRLSFRAAEWIKEPRLRGKSQISCLLEGKRTLLRKGDWAIKEDKKWRVLKTEKQKNAYLLEKPSKELFVFDSIEEQADKKVVKGRFFNPMRCDAKEISLPVISPNRKKLSGAKKWERPS